MHKPVKHDEVMPADRPGLLAPDTSGMNFYRADPALTDLLRIHLPDALFRHRSPRKAASAGGVPAEEKRQLPGIREAHQRMEDEERVFAEKLTLLLEKNHVSQAEFIEVLAAAARDAHRTLRLADVRGQAKDHPILLNVPETAYLKCVIAVVSN